MFITQFILNRIVCNYFKKFLFSSFQRLQKAKNDKLVI